MMQMIIKTSGISLLLLLAACDRPSGVDRAAEAVTETPAASRGSGGPVEHIHAQERLAAAALAAGKAWIHGAQ